MLLAKLYTTQSFHPEVGVDVQYHSWTQTMLLLLIKFTSHSMIIIYSYSATAIKKHDLSIEQVSQKKKTLWNSYKI